MYALFMYTLLFAGLAGVLTVFAVPPALSRETENKIQQEIERRLAAGETPNRLKDEQSPYLLQHAFNPVDWYPWGEEAFARAREENKPVFLSIGYSTCHWCHVMADESFEDVEVARVLNEWFVSIKVDREERPDIDQMYMAATQAISGGGGWPMSVFLLPDGSPFYAGTYFPPKASYNLPSFTELLHAIHKAWGEKKGDIDQAAARLVEALESSARDSEGPIGRDAIDKGYDQIAQSYDSTYGGFGKAPKFPRPVVLSLMFDRYHAKGLDRARDMALHTLDEMAAGGMHDQLGGGFHRYSVDQHWFVPHFEKMLYDQAQLANSYLDAYQITGDPAYADTARDIFTYLLRDMRDPAGGFYSAEDADSDNPYKEGEHSEGAFYLWSREHVRELLGSPAAEIFIHSYGVEENGNVEQDPHHEFTGLNILARQHDVEQTAAALKMDVDQVVRSLEESREKLMRERDQRRRPHLDDKILTAWNGMVIGALARGGAILQESDYLEAAARTAEFIKEHLYDEQPRTLKRRYRNGTAGLAGQLDDYAFLVSGLLELYQASHVPRWLEWSKELTETQMELFWNEEDSFFYDSVEDPTLKVRMREGHDGAEPSGNSVAAYNLLRLSQFYNNSEWRKRGGSLIESFADSINRYPTASPLMLTAWRQINAKSSQVVVAGTPGSKDTDALLAIVHHHYDPARLVMLADGGKNQEFLGSHQEFMQTVTPVEGKAAAYVCRNFVCKLPVTEPADLKRQLAGSGKEG
ncbi:MAG: thioredoxin domain-containing protein [Desulfofustis sp.]|nr:thioredoxin domain-containing protein [Desulfofustis sp.]